MMDKFNYKNLCSIKGNVVSLMDEHNNTVELTVAEVNAAKEHDKDKECFSVLLTGQPSYLLSQGTYNVKHDVIGDVPVFISPNSETEYEIIINRQVQ
ncbi:hypothetical protein [Pleionea sp. CnH1-48]|uniref:DUF6916 family protein n=1 Tax=Pleionea sp. CnH1-48 TaxID=2954494 RepID=UPI00209826E9|nr:hypothetical protein [Pleionea sp. CnH1-48]MCO7227299.1 hypothetical protein [Pleionea sp. CnH1-48]